MKLRPYQLAAVDAVYEAWQNASSTLIVQPTGTGKTVTFAEVIRRKPHGRAMVLAHREELIRQAQQKIHRVTNAMPDVEMGEHKASSNLFTRSDVVVSSVQTQLAGCGGQGRMTRFKPADFSVLILDECHHFVSPHWRKVIQYYRQNPNLKVLGVTATPDRADEAALGEIFDTVAFDYDLPEAIHDGWLVPIQQRAVFVENLDLSNVRTTAGDLNEGDLARALLDDRTLDGVVHPTLELAGERRTLIFATGVFHAAKLVGRLNGHRDGIARLVTGKTPKDERAMLFREYAAGRFQFLVNIGIATEGFDDPGIELVVMARPTKSRSLYAQMAGRATRPADSIAHVLNDLDNDSQRRELIASSIKPSCEIIDFVGNSGRHKLVTTADILGGRYADGVVERAKKKAEAAGKAGRAADMQDLLEEAQQEIQKEKDDEAAALQRTQMRSRPKYSTTRVDPFDVLHLPRMQERGWEVNKPPSEKMVTLLEKFGVSTDGLSFTDARHLIGELLSRRENNQCSFKQAKLLKRYGYSTDVSFQEASQIIDRLAKNGWKPVAVAPPAGASPVEIF